MKGKRKFLIFCMIFVANYSFSQQIPRNPATFKPFRLLLNSFPGKPFPIVINNKVLDPDFYSKNLGFFCRQEIKLESATRVPFRFRLGSVQHCDWLEGKQGYRAFK